MLCLFLCFKSVFKKNNFFIFSLLQINIFLFSDHFDALILKLIFKKLKKIILMHFQIKNTLKNNHNHTFNRLLMLKPSIQLSLLINELRDKISSRYCNSVIRHRLKYWEKKNEKLSHFKFLKININTEWSYFQNVIHHRLKWFLKRTKKFSCF